MSSRKPPVFSGQSGEPELWDGVTGKTRKLQRYVTNGGLTSIDMEFEPYQSCFVIFNRNGTSRSVEGITGFNYPEYKKLKTLEGSWGTRIRSPLGWS